MSRLSSNILAIVLFLSALVVRIRYISAIPIGQDEAFTLYYSNLPVKELWAFLFKGDNPPLWDTVVKYWTTWFSDSLHIARLLPVICSSLAAVFIYKIGDEFFNRWTGVLASLLFAFSNFSIYLSHDTRSYSLIVLLSSISFFYYLKFISSYTMKYFYLVLLVNTMVCYTHYMAIWVVLIQILGLVYSKERVRLGKEVLWSTALFFITCTPLLYFFIIRFADSGVHGTWHQPIRSLSPLFYVIGRSFNSPVLATLALVSIVFTLFVISKDKNTLRRIVLFWFVIPHSIIYIYSWYRSFYFDKYLYFTSPAIAILVAYGLSLISKKKAILISSIFLCIQLYDLEANTAKLNYHGVRPDYSEIVNFLKANYQSTPIFILNPMQEKDLLYYLDRERFRNVNIHSENNLIARSLFATYHTFFIPPNKLDTIGLDSFYCIATTREQREYMEALQSNFQFYRTDSLENVNITFYKNRVQ